MSFGNDLTKEFQKLTRNGESQEVELITKLKDAFINLANGSRNIVDFEYNAS